MMKINKIDRWLMSGERVKVTSSNGLTCLCERQEEVIKILALFDVTATGFLKQIESAVQYLDWLALEQVEKYPEVRMGFIVIRYDYEQWNDVIWSRVLTALLCSKVPLGSVAGSNMVERWKACRVVGED